MSSTDRLGAEFLYGMHENFSGEARLLVLRDLAKVELASQAKFDVELNLGLASKLVNGHLVKL